MCRLFSAGVLAVAVAGAFAAFGAARSMSDLEGVLAPGDATNGGFWDVSERASSSVDDGEASLGGSVDTSGGSAGEFWMHALDARAFTWEESGLTAVRTDPFIGLRIILL